MSLLAALGRVSERDDEAFLKRTDQVSGEVDTAVETGPDETVAPELVVASPSVTGQESGKSPHPAPTTPLPPLDPVYTTDRPTRLNVAAHSASTPRDIRADAPSKPLPDPPAVGLVPDTAEPTGFDTADADVQPDRPDGVPESSGAIALTPEEREVAFAGSPVIGSVVDGGPAQDMIDGKYPRPSVESQREIDHFNRIRAAGLNLNRPWNWPEFMTFPTENEMLALKQPGVTPEMIKGFEESKQQQADQMMARAKEISTWIFNWGDAEVNGAALQDLSRNRTLAIKRRATGPDGKVNKDQKSKIDPEVLTDEELYGDRHYGIRFALLLNPDPSAISKLRSAPVASWGHDQLRTTDGGRLQIKGDEIIVRTSSAEAAKLLVMEARARGWETIRVSGHNEFCAAVKRFAKEEGLGAIISRRGPLGFGPFSRPEVIMPPIPMVQPLNLKDPGEQERQKKSGLAPEGDRKAAEALLDPVKPSERPVRVKDPLAGPSRTDPSPGHDPSGPEPS
jgi:hypothetical protein